MPLIEQFEELELDVVFQTTGFTDGSPETDMDEFGIE